MVYGGVVNQDLDRSAQTRNDKMSIVLPRTASQSDPAACADTAGKSSGLSRFLARQAIFHQPGAQEDQSFTTRPGAGDHLAVPVQPVSLPCDLTVSLHGRPGLCGRRASTGVAVLWG
jgi:hypothetical protein